MKIGVICRGLPGSSTEVREKFFLVSGGFKKVSTNRRMLRQTTYYLVVSVMKTVQTRILWARHKITSSS
jgi:hypothetical protein